MKKLKCILTLTTILIGQALIAQDKTVVKNFNKVIISPHIETTFVQGEENSVTVLENTASDDKVNIEVKGETLRVYLDDAKEVTKQKKIKKNGIRMKVPIYKGKVLTILVTYKNIDNLSLRGEQKTLCESPIEVNDFKLKIYGESEVTFSDIKIKDLDVDIYGESILNINNGKTDYQSITAYGEAIVNMFDVDNKTSKLKAYGEAEFKVKSSEHIKFTAYGEADLQYKVNAEVSKGLSFGDSKIAQVED